MILVVAGLTTIIFRALKQPLVLGYIVAGFFTGPYFNYLPNVVDINNIKFWGDIGVIFLLFGLGLEFSFKKLKHVGGIGFVTVLTEIIVMFSSGYIIARLFGWSWMNAVFLGGMLTISSTSIIIKAFDDLGLKHKRFASVVFGVLIVEDIVAVLQLVILSALAGASLFIGSEVIKQLLYLSLFLLFWFTGGVYIIPAFLRKIKKWVNDEIILIFSLGLCLGMVVLTQRIGFSAALGAFIMGSILSECDEYEKIIKLTKPIKDFFGAIFFISVGMLVNPVILQKYWFPVIIISLVVIIFKSLSATIG
ncbi:MAG: cation:proton antiporter, partial [Thiovulaceae bacterium]|nr:cation:proton antiporter [Sulfurimonadaceae bacterium]